MAEINLLRQYPRAKRNIGLRTVAQSAENIRIAREYGREYFVLGFEIGGSLPFASQWQRWVWADDELPTIEEAFADMVVRLEGAQPAARSAA
jgi:hypothetical protein